LRFSEISEQPIKPAFVVNGYPHGFFEFTFPISGIETFLYASIAAFMRYRQYSEPENKNLPRHDAAFMISFRKDEN
jgi:hypothetical protein